MGKLAPIAKFSGNEKKLRYHHVTRYEFIEQIQVVLKTPNIAWRVLKRHRLPKVPKEIQKSPWEVPAIPFSPKTGAGFPQIRVGEGRPLRAEKGRHSHPQGIMISDAFAV